MSSRLSNLLPLRPRSRRLVRAVASCDACGRSIVAHDHAIQLAGGNFHAGCVLYRRRAVAADGDEPSQRERVTR